MRLVMLLVVWSLVMVLSWKLGLLMTPFYVYYAIAKA